MSEQKQPANDSQKMERLVIEVGNPEFHPGLTRVQLGADGQVQIETRLYKEESRYEYRLEGQEAAALIERSSAPQLAVKAAGRKLGLPDEPRYKIEVYRGDRRVQSMEVWRSELPALGELGSVVRTLGEVVQRASDGQALL